LKQQRAIAKGLSAAIDGDPQIELVTLCRDFTVELGKFLNGNGSQPEYILQMRTLFVTLQELIGQTIPKLFADTVPNGQNGLNTTAQS
jgi:hypothetical protein